MKLTATERLAMASALNGGQDRMIKKAFSNLVGENAGMGKTLAAGGADLAASALIPGYMAASSGIDAFNSFRKGNIIGGIGNTALAGIGLIPGVGGITARSLKGVANIGKKFNMPTLLGNTAKFGLKGQKALNTGFNNFARSGIGKATIGSKPVKAVTSFAGKNPIKTTLAGGVGMGIQGSKFDDAQAASNNHISGMADTFKSLPGMANMVGMNQPSNPALIRPPGSTFGD